jgi:benzoylformate decarboxylase
VIVGQQDAPLEWVERFMGINISPMVSQVTKGCWMITEAEDVPLAVNRALKDVSLPTTRPVVLSMTTKVQASVIRYQPLKPQGRRVAMDIVPSDDALQAAAELIIDAENPVIFASRVVADLDAMAELVSFAETVGAPVFTGNEDKLIFPGSHPLSRGMVFQESNAMRNMASSADVLVTIGSELFKYSDAPEEPVVPESTKVIQIDLDSRELAKFCPTEMTLLANPKLTLAALQHIVSDAVPADRRAARMSRLTEEYNQRQQFVDDCLNQDWQDTPIRWGAAFRELSKSLPDSAIVVDELASFYGQLPKVIKFDRPGSYFGHCEALGWGLPATLGVALGSPDKTVVGILGDGGALFCIQALWTAAKYQIPAVIVIINNGGYGCMRGLFQGYGMQVDVPMDAEDCDTYDIGDVNLCNIASDFGVMAKRVEDPRRIQSVMDEMIALKKPALVELMVCPNGSGLYEMVAEFFK